MVAWADPSHLHHVVKAMQAKCREMKMTWNHGNPPHAGNVAEFKREIKDLAANSFPTGTQWAHDLLVAVERPIASKS